MKQFEKSTDTEIIEKIRNGEKFLYEMIVRRYNPYLYKIGRSYRYNHEDTQDLMQETYVDAYRNLHQFENRSSFRTWIVRIMLNNCFKRKEKASFKHEFAQEDINESAQPMFTHSHNDANKTILSKELGHLIEQALEEIPQDYRMVFTLREITGLNVAETAELLDISEANVKVRLSRAKDALRERLQKYYSPSDIYEFNLIYCNAMVDRVMKEIKNL